MKKRIHVNKHVIAANRKHGRDDPPLRVKTYKDNIEAHQINIMGSSVVVHSPHKPLACGARVWIETDARVICAVSPAEEYIID